MRDAIVAGSKDGPVRKLAQRHEGDTDVSASGIAASALIEEVES